MKWHWQKEELREHWSLSAEELHLVAGRTDHGRMGFVVMLKFFQYQGRFPSAIKDLPVDVVRFLSQQIGASQYDLDPYDWDGRTATRQRAEILSFLGIRRMTSERMQPLLVWLNDDLLPQDYSLEQLLERVGDWFCELKIAPPSPPQLNRLGVASEFGKYRTLRKKNSQKSI